MRLEYIHLVVEDLGLASGGVGDKGLVENLEDVLADGLELGLDLLPVLLDNGDVLLGALGLLLLLNGGDDAPAGAASADDVLVGNGKEVALVNGELTTELGDLLHEGNHLIVALSLLAEAGEESLAVDSPSRQYAGCQWGQIHRCRCPREQRATGSRQRNHTHLSRYTKKRANVSIIVAT